MVMDTIEFGASIATATEASLGTYTVPSSPGFRSITSIGIQGADCQYIRIVRSSHPADDIYLPCLAATGAVQNGVIDLVKHNAAIDIKAAEVITVYGYQDSGGAQIVNAHLTVSTGPGKNLRGIRVAGTAAAVASTLTASGGSNVVAALDPNLSFKLRASFLHSTTMYGATIEGSDKMAIQLPGNTDVGLGIPLHWLPENATVGGKNQQWITSVAATAADAANTQYIYLLWEVGA